MSMGNLDTTHVRQGSTCPLCNRLKDVGLIVCWPCYKRHAMKYGNPRCEAIIAEREEALRALKAA
jgi:hypothetical protein